MQKTEFILKFIEISDGLSVRMDEIEAVGYGTSNLTSKVFTHHNIYDSTFPYGVLLELISNKEPEYKKEELNILKTLGTFSG